MKKILIPLTLLLSALSLVGCGLKGPLYFPKEDLAKPPVQSATSTTPSASATSETQQPATTSGQSVQPAQ